MRSKKQRSIKAPLNIWFAALIAGGAVAGLLYLAYWLLIDKVGLSPEDLFFRSGGGIATGVAAVVATLLLYYRWTVDHRTQEKLHRQQQRGERQENLGDRMAKAVDHLGQNNSYTQVAGLIELATLVDDWWALGQEMLADLDGDSPERERVKSLVGRRRQELVDLIFKNNPTPENTESSSGSEDSEGISERERMLRQARSQILRSHLTIENPKGEVPDDPDSWRHLNLENSHLEEAYLIGAYLHGAQLSGAHLEEASLQEANLEEAYLTTASLNGAQLEQAHLNGAKLVGAHLNGAHLNWAQLIGANLNWAQLIGANLEEAQLIGAYLNRAHLEEANLEEANLNGAHLHGVYLFGANLNGANLNGARLRSAHLDDHYAGKPTYDDNTRWSKGYEPQNAGFKKTDEAT